MKRLYVYADFDWLKDTQFVGELSYESLRGSDCYGFKFSNEWHKQHGDIFLSDDINPLQMNARLKDAICNYEATGK